MQHRMRFTVEKITQRLGLIQPLVFRQSVPLPDFECLALADARTDPFAAARAASPSEWTRIAPGAAWLGWKQDYVLRAVFSVPVALAGGGPVALFLPLGDEDAPAYPEALVYLDGVALAGCDRNHRVLELPAAALDGQPHELLLHGWTSNNNWHVAAGPHMGACQIVQIDEATRRFVAQVRVMLGVAKALDVNDPARAALLNALDAAFVALDTREPLGDGFYVSLPKASAALDHGLAEGGAPLPVTVAATGHAHIDVAWLWTLAQTRRKAGRTFHSVIRLMDEFPDFHFTQSQPQLYEYVRQDYPALFRTIQERAARGQWELIGGMWVEADCNLTGAEALARQFVLGQAFFKEHFPEQTPSPVLWLPDVFGYAWSLPQIIREAGLEYFFTIKIGWNEYNKLPYDSFWWQGIDGTRVLTHFSTTPDLPGYTMATYNARATPEQVIGTWTQFQQKDQQSELLMAFGFGDGGGGPTREMLENLTLMADFPGVPRTRLTSAGDFFRELDAASGARLPVWNGELYLEYHRGTYTSQARNKRANRKSEFLLHDTEFLASYLSALRPEYAYPQAEMTQAWRLLCLNQFHDIIPGSSIGEVYVDSQRDYAAIRELVNPIREQALRGLAEVAGGDVLLANPAPFVSRDPVFVPDLSGGSRALAGADGVPLPVQAAEGGVWVAPGILPPHSVTALRWVDATAEPPGGLVATPHGLENGLLRVELNDAGDIVRLFDKRCGREVIPPGEVANQWQLLEDRTHTPWDAWDTAIYHDDRCTPAEPAERIAVVEAGPLRATIEIERQIGQSRFVQRLSLAAQSARLDIETVIQWRERHAMLKAAFPVEVLAPTASYEIQWGHVARPTHRNTSWDWARFETCAQKWVDLSEGDYGVSLLNDCKYGHDIQGHVMRISLLRAPTFPDAEADQGEHIFSYSLLAHSGSLGIETIEQSYLLNDPVIVHVREGARGVDGGQSLVPLFTANRSNIVIETIKAAEDGDGLIVRLYEAQRQRGTVTLTAAFPLEAAWRTNLLEANQAALAVDGQSVTLDFTPFQIVTVRLSPSRRMV